VFSSSWGRPAWPGSVQTNARLAAICMEKRTIVLANPKSGLWAANALSANTSPPVGPLAAAVFIHEHYEIIVIDQNFTGWENRLTQALERNPLLFGVSFMTGAQIKNALEMCAHVRERSKCTIVAGGVHPSILPQQTAAHELIDIAVRGEGEKTIFEVAQALESGRTLDQIRGIAFKENGSVQVTESREHIDLDSLPPIPYGLVPGVLDYPFIKKYGLIIETSRGCPFACTYCYNAAFCGRTWRSKSPGKVLQEIAHYRSRYGIGHFHIIDDNFFVDAGRAKTILKETAKMPGGIRLEFQGVRADTICHLDDETLRLVKQLNDGTFRIGIESGSDTTLQAIQKKTTVAINQKANQILRDKQIKAYYNFMIGFPFETVADLKQTTRFAVELMDANPFARIDFMANYQPYPGTALFDDAVSHDFISPPQSLAEWSNFNWDTSKMRCFTSQHRALLERVSIASLGLILRKKSDYAQLPRGTRIIARIYRHIVRFRMKHFFFSLFFEKYFYALGIKLMNR
jgi:anaerobic magnesium-protoporphyrin IX monomethyl ester cyclase